MILNPGEHFKKADELKVIYMIFDSIDTLDAYAFYSIKEMDQDFARKIMEQESVGEEIYNNDVTMDMTVDITMCEEESK